MSISTAVLQAYILPLTKQTPFLACDQHYTKQSIGLRRYQRVLECAPCVNISMCPYIRPAMD